MREVSLNLGNQPPHPSIQFDDETGLRHSFVDMSTIGSASPNVDQLMRDISRPPTKIVVPLEEPPAAPAPTVVATAATPPSPVVAPTVEQIVTTPLASQPDTPVKSQSCYGWFEEKIRDVFFFLWWLIKKAFCCGS